MIKHSIAALLALLFAAPSIAGETIKQKKSYGRAWTLFYATDDRVGRFCSLDSISASGDVFRLTAYESRNFNIMIVNEKWNIPKSEIVKVTAKFDDAATKSTDLFRLRTYMVAATQAHNKEFFFDFLRGAEAAKMVEIRLASGESMTLDLTDFRSALKDWQTCAQEWTDARINIAAGTAQAPIRAQDMKGAAKLQVSTGTGIVISPDGAIVTNAHVAGRCGKISVQLGEKSWEATLLKSDAKNDLAALQVKAQFSRYALIAEQPSDLGAKIAVFGYPLTGALSSGGNFTLGSITGLSGYSDDKRHYQISAPIQAGNSGGPVVDKKARLVGVVRSSLVATAGAPIDAPQNVNFAIRASVLKSFLDGAKIPYTTATGPAGRDRSDTDLASAAKAMSVLVTCTEKP